jgi:hypothetical protein
VHVIINIPRDGLVDEIPVEFMKIKEAPVRLLLRAGSSDLSLTLKSWTALLTLSTHAAPLLPFPHELRTIGMLPIAPSPNTANFLAPYLYKL